jgi:gliding motility-associated lipoprotein GldD
MLNRHWIVLLVSFLVISCNETYTPKPRAYFRIEFPEKTYTRFENDGPCTFEIPKYSFIQKDTSKNAEDNWNNLVFPQLKGKLYLTYKELNNDLSKYMEDSRTLAYKHTIKADAITEQVFIDPEKRIYGILYEIKGNAASPYQFFATDSTKHFLRGSLYFNVYPNKDSLAPVFDFIKPDIIHLIETIEWN